MRVYFIDTVAVNVFIDRSKYIVTQSRGATV